MLKHGESAYPADAWVEQQYMKEDALSGGVSSYLCFFKHRGHSQTMLTEFWLF